jgi:hypothetical protein
MAATCDGLRVRTLRDLVFHRSGAFFTVAAGTVGGIVDNEATRAYTTRHKAFGRDLIPVQLDGMVRYVDRNDLEVVR